MNFNQRIITTETSRVQHNKANKWYKGKQIYIICKEQKISKKVNIHYLKYASNLDKLIWRNTMKINLKKLCIFVIFN